MLSAIIVGVLSGVVSSWMAWWILNYFGSPKIGFSENIKKQISIDNNSGYYYQFKIGNLKKIDAVDISINAKVYFPDIAKEGITNIYTIPIDGNYQFELIPNRNDTPGWARQLTLKINDEKLIKEFDRYFFDDAFKLKIIKKQLILEDLLQITPKAFIRIYVSATDAFSGSRRVFRSKNYYLRDIKFGNYERFSLNIIEESEK